MLPLGQVLANHSIHFHCYANDIQLYLPLKPCCQTALQALLDCLADLKIWLHVNFLNLNESKTEIVVFGKPSLATSTQALGSLIPNMWHSVSNLGVILYSSFKPDKQFSAVVGFFSIYEICLNQELSVP